MGRREREKGARFEREVARTFGTERVGTRGKADGADADVHHAECFIQCKRRARLAIGRWWRETVAGAERSGKTPLLVVREDRGEPLVVMRLTDYLKGQ